MNTKKSRKNNELKRLRVIQITGLRGILSAVFVVTCLAAGFIGFPSFVVFKLWNFIAETTQSLPLINIFQGMLLWGILGISYLIMNEKKRYLVAFEPKAVSGKDIREIIREIKRQSGEFMDDNELAIRKYPSENNDNITVKKEEKDEIYDEK